MISNCVICGRFFRKRNSRHKTDSKLCSIKYRYTLIKHWHKEKIKDQKYYTSILELSRIRANEYYNKNRNLINKKRKERWKTDIKYRKKLTEKNAEYEKNNREKINNMKREYYKNIENRKRKNEQQKIRRSDPEYRIKLRAQQRLSRERLKPIKKERYYSDSEYREKILSYFRTDIYKLVKNRRRRYQYKQHKETESLAVTIAALTQSKTNKE